MFFYWKNLINDKEERIVIYLDTGETYVKLFNNDNDVFEIIHELAHYIELDIFSRLVERNKLFGEVPVLYSEKKFLRSVMKLVIMKRSVSEKLIKFFMIMKCFKL